MSRTSYLNAEKCSEAPPRGALAFKPAPNPALNKPLEGNANQKRLLKSLHEPAHIRTHRVEDVSDNGCLCVPGLTTQRFYFNQQL